MLPADPGPGKGRDPAVAGPWPPGTGREHPGMDRATADRLVQDHEGRRPASLDLFLGYLGISEDEFHRIVAQTVVAPHRPDPAAIPRGAPTHDFAAWYRETG